MSYYKQMKELESRLEGLSLGSPKNNSGSDIAAEVRFDHEFVGGACIHCDLSNFCDEVECPARLREEVNRLYDFNEKGMVCSKHWVHPSKCCNGSYSAMLVSSKAASRAKKELERAKRYCLQLEEKLRAIRNIMEK
jgi:hypothetical protein